MLKNACLLAKIGADTAENGRHFALKFAKSRPPQRTFSGAAPRAPAGLHPRGPVRSEGGRGDCGLRRRTTHMY